MAIKQRISTATFTDWTKYETNGVLSLVTFDGYQAIKLVKSANSFNAAGIARTAGIQMLNGDRLYCKWQSDVIGEWFVEAMRNTNVLTYDNGSTNFYGVTGGIYAQFGDSASDTGINPFVTNVWWDFYWEKQPDNTLTNFAKLQSDSLYTDIGHTVSSDYNTIPVNLAFQGYYGGPNSYYLAEAYWTDSGLFTPPAPTTLAAEATGESTIDLTWSDATVTSTNADEIVIFRSESEGGPYVEIDTVAIGEEAYSDSGLSAETTYYYVVAARVSAYGDDWDSADSDEASATTDESPDTGSDGEDLLACEDL